MTLYATENHEPEDGILRFAAYTAASPQQAAVLVARATAEQSALDLSSDTVSTVLVAELVGEGLELSFWHVQLTPHYTALPLTPALAMGGAL